MSSSLFSHNAVFPYLAFFSLLAINSPASGVEEVTSVTPADSHIEYAGRVTGLGTDTVTQGYSGARIQMRFTGTSIALLMDDSGQNYIQVWLNGELLPKIELNAVDGRYLLGENLEEGRDHTVDIVRVTEGAEGLTHFKGFELGGSAQVLELPVVVRPKIEFIGDSITCGYGVEVDDRDLHYEAATENFCLGYTGLTAKNLDAEYLVVSRSGMGMIRGYDGPFDGSAENMTTVYENSFFLDDGSDWDFNAFIPDLVCINLGTNDFSTTGVNTTKFEDSYVEFASGILDRYPTAKLVVLQGPMNNSPELRSSLDRTVVRLEAYAPGRVNFFELSAQGGVGYGADWHPNKAQSVINAVELTTYLSGLMNWSSLNVE